MDTAAPTTDTTVHIETPLEVANLLRRVVVLVLLLAILCYVAVPVVVTGDYSENSTSDYSENFNSGYTSSSYFDSGGGSSYAPYYLAVGLATIALAEAMCDYTWFQVVSGMDSILTTTTVCSSIVSSITIVVTTTTILLLLLLFAIVILLCIIIIFFILLYYYYFYYYFIILLFYMLYYIFIIRFVFGLHICHSSSTSICFSSIHQAFYSRRTICIGY
jgi:hypothetical protein